MEFHGRELRKGRRSEPGRRYLITAVTASRHPLFADLYAARLLVAELRRADRWELAHSLAWVVMPDHLHWLCELRGIGVGVVLNAVKSRSAVAVNRYLGRRGRVWQRGYHDHAMRAEEDLRTAARYIIWNPIRAGLVASVGDYPHWDAVWL